jgi:hypothetical protein
MCFRLELLAGRYALSSFTVPRFSASRPRPARPFEDFIANRLGEYPEHPNVPNLVPGAECFRILFGEHGIKDEWQPSGETDVIGSRSIIFRLGLANFDRNPITYHYAATAKGVQR